MEIEQPGAFVAHTSIQAPRIASADTATAGFVGAFAAGPRLEPTLVQSREQFRDLFELPSGATISAVAVHEFFAAGGQRAVVVRVGAQSDPATVDELVAGLAPLRAPNDGVAPLQLLAIPDMARRSSRFSHGDYSRLVGSATRFCVENRILLLVDPNTAGDTLGDIHEWLELNTGWGSTNSAVYFPHLITSAGLQAGLDAVPASGAVAGVMARTDTRRGVWKTPAGREATIDAVIAEPLSDQDQSPLNRMGVNVIRRFDPAGAVIWGSRTGAGSVADEFRHVPVRRTALFLENSLRRGLDWVRSEPNDALLWQRIRKTVEDFLDALWRQGAFVGTRATEAYFVRCGPATMSRVDVRRGRTIVQVGFAPLRPAEFIVISVTIVRRRR